MRYFYVIPALLLFLSNIPFVQQMRMEEMKKMSIAKTCCEKRGNMEGTCHKGDKEQHSTKHRGGCEKPESSCICVCCFQYTAPEHTQIIFDCAKFSFAIKYNIPPQPHWLDPYISAQWQPPDFAFTT